MYGSVAEASAYHAARGNIDWDTLGTDTDHEIALTRGSDYIDGTYGARFAGSPTDPDQINAWPRTGATIYGSSIAGSVVPLRVVHASYEAALIETSQDRLAHEGRRPSQEGEAAEGRGHRARVLRAGHRQHLRAGRADLHLDRRAARATHRATCRPAGDHGGVTWHALKLHPSILQARTSSCACIIVIICRW
jgi:hypothetical protein